MPSPLIPFVNTYVVSNPVDGTHLSFGANLTFQFCFSDTLSAMVWLLESVRMYCNGCFSKNPERIGIVTGMFVSASVISFSLISYVWATSSSGWPRIQASTLVVTTKGVLLLNATAAPVKSTVPDFLASICVRPYTVESSTLQVGWPCESFFGISCNMITSTGLFAVKLSDPV